eukprot:7277774-Prymnesium_polylepis.1
MAARAECGAPRLPCAHTPAATPSTPGIRSAASRGRGSHGQQALGDKYSAWAVPATRCRTKDSAGTERITRMLSCSLDSVPDGARRHKRVRRVR